MGRSSARKKLAKKNVPLAKLYQQVFRTADLTLDAFLAVIVKLQSGETYTAEELAAEHASVIQVKEIVTGYRAQVAALLQSLNS